MTTHIIRCSRNHNIPHARPEPGYRGRKLVENTTCGRTGLRPCDVQVAIGGDCDASSTPIFNIQGSCRWPKDRKRMLGIHGCSPWEGRATIKILCNHASFEFFRAGPPASRSGLTHAKLPEIISPWKDRAFPVRRMTCHIFPVILHSPLCIWLARFSTSSGTLSNRKDSAEAEAPMLWGRWISNPGVESGRPPDFENVSFLVTPSRPFLFLFPHVFLSDPLWEVGWGWGLTRILRSVLRCGRVRKKTLARAVLSTHEAVWNGVLPRQCRRSVRVAMTTTASTTY